MTKNCYILQLEKKLCVPFIVHLFAKVPVPEMCWLLLLRSVLAKSIHEFVGDIRTKRDTLPFGTTA
jgi:hypothetical protein